MSSEKSLTPQIRFKGFTEAWEQRKLGDYLLLSTEKNTNLQYGIEDVLSVSWTAGVVNQIEFQGRSFAGSNLSGYDVAHHECVIYTKSPLKDEPFGIIKTNYLTSGIVSQLYAVYRTNSLGNPAFVETYFSQTARLNNYLRPLVNKGAKNTMNISDEEALKGGVIFPLLEEQDSISSLFLLIDRLITLHQRKLDAIKKIKSALLEKMFPKDGSDIPEIRFTGFTEAWEQRKLGKLLEINDAKNINLIDSSKTISVSSMSWNPAGNGASANSLGSYKVLNYGEMAFEGNRTKGHPYGKLVINDIGTGIMSSRFRTLKPTSFICVPFWKFYLSNKTIFTPIFLNSTKRGTLMNELVVSDLLKQSVMLPITDEEQIRIGTLFVRINNLITLHQRKLDALKKIKSALLEKMFV